MKAESIARVREIVERSGMGSHKLARAAGIAPSTLFRALDANSHFIPTGRTIAKLEAVVGVADAGPVGRQPVRAPGVELTGLPGGKARLRFEGTIPMSTALKVLALLEGGE